MSMSSGSSYVFSGLMLTSGPLADLADVVESSLGRVASADVAAQVRGRLALYRVLVPRIERLAAPELAVRQHEGAE